MRILERFKTSLHSHGTVRMLGAVLILFLLTAGYYILPRRPWVQTGDDQVRFGYVSSAASAPFFVAQEQGLFRGLELKVKNYQEGSDLISDLLDGTTHIGYVGSVPTLVAATQTTPVPQGSWFRKPPDPLRMPVQHHSQVKVLAVASMSEGSEGILVRPELGIETVAGLAERRIAVASGTTSHRFLLEVIGNAGLEPEKDVQLIDMDPEEQIEAFRTGAVDAAAVWEPYKHRLIASGARILLDDTHAVINSYDLITANSAWVATHTELAEAFLQAHFQATEWLNTHRKEAATIVARWLRQPVGEVEYILDSYRRPSEHEIVGSDEFRNLVERDMVYDSQFLYNLGLIERLPNVDRLLWSRTDSQT